MAKWMPLTSRLGISRYGGGCGALTRSVSEAVGSSISSRVEIVRG
jgi:hypothetical protein